MPDRAAENAGNGNSQRRLKTDGAGQHGSGEGWRESQTQTARGC